MTMTMTMTGEQSKSRLSSLSYPHQTSPSPSSPSTPSGPSSLSTSSPSIASRPCPSPPIDGIVDPLRLRIARIWLEFGNPSQAAVEIQQLLGTLNIRSDQLGNAINK
jgi:hypothetical protein